MAKDNLLKEAIADAKAVKEAAIANAMLTLKESFKPQLTSMLAAKLRNESDDMDADDTVDEQKKLDSSDIGGPLNVDNPAPKKPSAVTSTSSDIENKGQEVDTFGEGIEDMGDHSEPDQDQFGGPSDMDADNQGGDDLDLEAIIRELEADLAGNSEDDMGADPYADDNSVPENAFVTGTESGTDAMHAMKEGEAGGIENDGKNLENEKGVDSWKKVAEGDEEVDLEEILREMDAEDDDVNESEQIASENVELKRNLREHREVIKLLRNRINEVTLLNSKLMYTTKIFRSFDLSESQKKKVVEQFDRAGTLRETKLVYSTLAESLTGKIGTATPRKVVANITEGASKPVGSTKPKSQTVLAEGDTQVARMQKLAGIIRG